MSQVTGENSQNAKTKCWKCGLVCKNKQGLSTHQNKCLNGAPKGASFYRDERIELNTLPARKQDSTNEKSLPATQPLVDATSQHQVWKESNHEKVLPASQPLNPFDDAMTKAAVVIRENKDIRCDKEKLVKVADAKRMENQRVADVSVTNSREEQVKSLTHATTPERIASEEINCPICRIDVTERSNGVVCNMCHIWSHRTCLFLPEDIAAISPPSAQLPWYCTLCQSIRSNKIKWGTLEGEVTIKSKISSIYDEVTQWRKNLFLLPRGKVGTDLIKEMTRLIRLFTNETKWTRIALAQLQIFLPLMLQKPSSKSKAKDHVKYLEKRLKLWHAGELDSILAENREIQKKVKENQDKRAESKEKTFCRLMLVGKLSQAAKFVDSENDTRGVHSLTAEIKQILEQKHPKASTASDDILLEPTSNEPEPVIFEGIDESAVYRAAKHLQGSGGPSLMDADGWKHILCSKSYGNASRELCAAIADLAKKLCREPIHPESLHELVANRLIPLDKGADKNGKPGVRPIGIGEILRRIIGKVVIGNIREDILNAAGPLQTCAGLQSGIEASIHAMRKIFDKESTEAILLVDAENAFNLLNRKAALHNIKELCPSFFRYLSNTYQIPAKMIINDHENSDHILSEEGTTQGDVTAMAMYAIGIRPLIDILHQKTDTSKCQQVWYADDSTVAGQLREMKKWWDLLYNVGPKYGYHPKPSKTILIVKNREFYDEAVELFEATGVKITLTGERHLGAVIGSENFRKEYIENKVKKWSRDVQQLAAIAKDEPQLAYSAYTKAISMRWCFLQRTIPDTGQYFIPLEETIREKLIPAIIGRKINDLERKLVSLPVRLGGLGIQDPTLSADIEYRSSSIVTQSLTNLIENQEEDLSNYDSERVKRDIQQVKSEKEEMFLQRLEEVKIAADDKLRRSIELACEKSAGAWLSALPLQAMGFLLNKQEFRDGICLRYGWKIPNTPTYCGCGQKNTVDHTLSCLLGGYVTMRHNSIRNLEANMLREVCKDVKVEPELLPIGNSETQSSNRADKARLDVSAVGVWSSMERTYLDVRVFHPNSPSYVNTSPQQLYTRHEKEKKRDYNNRVLQVEKGSFAPLILSTTGGMGPESTKFHRRLAELVATKRGEEYSHVVSHIRTRLRFAILRCTLVAIRGERGRQRRRESPLSDISFNLVPERDSYEM